MKKIFVFGDSIVYGKWDEKGGWVSRLRYYIDQKYNYLPKPQNVLVYNCGIPSELSIYVAERMENELQARKEDDEKAIVILATGINDSCRNNYATGKQTDEQTFKDAIKKCINICKANNCTVLVVGLLPTNKEKSKGLMFNDNDAEQYDMYLTDVCRAENVNKLELFNELLQRNFSELLVDSVHPNSDGHEILFIKIKDFLVSKGFIK